MEAAKKMNPCVCVCVGVYVWVGMCGCVIINSNKSSRDF